MKNFSDFWGIGYNKTMAILEYIENLPDEEPSLALKMFKESCCDHCSCKPE